MNEMEELESKIDQSQLLANLTALRIGLEAVIEGLPHGHQRAVLAHLRKEADQIEASFSHPAAPQRAKALRSLAGSLETRHIYQAEAHWHESAKQETDPG